MPAPKLLPKKLVTATLATERKLEIDKGVKLAKAIDTLRDTKRTEEQALEEFREITIRQVQAEIDALFQERNRLSKEVKDLLELLNQHGRK